MAVVTVTQVLWGLNVFLAQSLHHMTVGESGRWFCCCYYQFYTQGPGITEKENYLPQFFPDCFCGVRRKYSLHQ